MKKKEADLKARQNIDLLKKETDEARDRIFQFIDKVHEQNKNVDPKVIEKEIYEAVQAIRKQKKLNS